MRRWTTLLPVLAVAVGGVAAVVLVAMAPARGVTARIPGMDRQAGAATVPGVDLRGVLVRGTGEKGEGSGVWAQFRGGMRTGIVDDSVSLKKTLSNLKTLWTVDVGDGYAGVAIHRGRVYVLDYDMERRADALRCLSLKDGREIFRRSYIIDITRNHGISRTVPAVTEDGKYVVTLGPKCHVVCLDAESGEFVWGKNLVREYGTKVPSWYASQCPLIEEHGEGANGPVVILAPGGEKVLMTSIEVATGRVVWETPNDLKWEMTHGSITPMEIDGVRQYVYCGSKGVAGVDAGTGKVLWSTAAWQISQATVPSPVDLGRGRVLLAGGYGAGAMLLDVSRQGDAWSTAVYKRLPPEQFGAEQQTPILFGGSVYGVRPDGQMACLTRDGEIKWTSGPGNFVGGGPFVIADGSLYAISNTGTLFCVEARPDQFSLQGKGAAIPKGRECWGPIAVADGMMIVRDLTRIVCLEMKR